MSPDIDNSGDRRVRGSTRSRPDKRMRYFYGRDMHDRNEGLAEVLSWFSYDQLMAWADERLREASAEDMVRLAASCLRAV